MLTMGQNRCVIRTISFILKSNQAFYVHSLIFKFENKKRFFQQSIWCRRKIEDFEKTMKRYDVNEWRFLVETFRGRNVHRKLFQLNKKMPKIGGNVPPQCYLGNVFPYSKINPPRPWSFKVYYNYLNKKWMFESSSKHASA